MLLSGKGLKHDFVQFVSATVASQVVFSLYSMVDGLMVSLGVNEYAMSAVNLAIPFTNALFSIAVLFAVGSSTLIAIAIAQDKRHEANTLFSQNFATLLILGAVATALVLLFLEPFARLLGADEITLDYVKHYLLGLAPFSVCYLVSYNLEVLVKTDGFPRYALFTVIAGCLTNCVLDYIAIFWLDMGVDGFREDVITFISKAEGLPNGFPLPVATGIEHYKSGPHLQEYLGEFRKVLDEYDCMTVGEAPMMTPKTAMKFIEENKDQKLNMMFHFQHMEADCLFYSWIRAPFSLRKLKNVYNNWQTKLYGKAWNTLYIENHDQPRIINRYGSLKYRVESGKMLATMYICQSGTPFIYQGQEIGMVNIGLPEIEMYEDVSTQNAYHTMRHLGFTHNMVMKVAKYASRDNARTPVQWSAEKNAGFTTADKPWFYINDNYKEINVEAAEKDENSILNYYRKLLKLRKENPIIIYGDFKMYNKLSRKLFVYERSYEGQRMLVINSFSEKPVKFKAPADFDITKSELLISNYDCKDKSNAFTLRPYESRAYLIK